MMFNKMLLVLAMMNPQSIQPCFNLINMGAFTQAEKVAVTIE